MIENKTTLHNCKQLEPLGEQSKSSEQPTQANNNGANFISQSKSQNQPVTSLIAVGSRQRRCSANNVTSHSNSDVTEYELEDRYYDEISVESEPVQDESSSSEASKLPDISNARPANTQSTSFARQLIVIFSDNGKACTNKNFVLALVAVAAILLTVIIIGVAMTGPKRRSATNTMRTRPITVNTTAINITATVTTSDMEYTYVGDNAKKRRLVDDSNEQTVILKTGFLANSGQRVVGARVFASKPSSRTPVNFGIYRLQSTFECHYTLIKSYPLKITAIDRAVNIMFEPSQQHTVTSDDTFGIWWSTKSGGSIYYDIKEHLYVWMENTKYCYSASKIGIGEQMYHSTHNDKLEAFGDQSTSSKPSQLSNYASRVNYISGCKSQNQAVMSLTFVTSRQDCSTSISQSNANDTIVAAYELEESYYDELGLVSEPVEDKSSSGEAPRLPDYKSRPANTQSTPVARQPSHINGKAWYVGADSSSCDVTYISTFQHSAPTNAFTRIFGTRKNHILALALVAAILLTSVVIGMSVTVYKRRSTNNSWSTLVTPTRPTTTTTTTTGTTPVIGQPPLPSPPTTPAATFTDNWVTLPSNLIKFDGNYTYVGDNAVKRRLVDESNEQTVILNTGFPLTSGQRVVGVRVFASKPNSRTPVNFGIYRRATSNNCHFTLINSFPLNITAVNTVFDITLEPSEWHTVTPGDTFGIWWSTKSGGSIYFDMENNPWSNGNYCYSISKSVVGVSASFTDRHNIRQYSVQAILM